ncbi:ubiquitin carboxyl-terminal hydrolase 43 isoform X2 [Drosophila sechellia]|uniref:ubiquitin carboxyl-terminal hydrolase 43 isoform X2 n=1 Tax=Drosophila sechellia TaxID=7238 RepID=UPI0013DD9FEE|nr:ubiquitin carboxyl-terminal hydrolase 43 isoform X2 [Drosophila sechellia]
MGTTKERREQSEGDAATTHSTTTATATTGAIVAAGVTTTLSATKTTTTAADTSTTNAAKKIRRTFSMPRNPFRWTRKFKTAAAVTSSAGAENDNESGKSNGARERRGSHTAISSCVGGGRGRSGSIVSLSSYEAPFISSTNNNTTTASNGNNNNSSSNNNNSSSSKRTRALRRSSFRKFLNRIAQHLSSTVNVVANKHGQPSVSGSSAGGGGGAGGPGGGERVPPIGGYQWPADQTPGVMGLKNHGNTCFMNAVLQCLSHTDILAEYFVLDQYKADLKRRNKINSRKFGTKGELTEQLANVLKALWTCKNESDHSTSFKAVVDRYGTQFRSSTQHDAQEFLFWLLDKVHEDLNTASKRRYKSLKNSYGRSDEVIAAETLANHIRCNNSFVQAVFQAQFRSSLTCPRCEKQSNTFDPFHCISVQLPQLTQQTIFVTVVYMKQLPRQVRMGLRVPAGSPIVALREQLQADTGIEGSRMVLVDLNAEGFTRVFYDTQPVETLSTIETIYCIEVPEATPVAKAATPSETGDKAAPTAVTPSPVAAQSQADLLLLVANVYRAKDDADITRFGAPFSMKAPRDCSYQDLQKRMLREMAQLLKPEVFSYATPLAEMFRIRLQDPSADPDSYLEQVEHPLLTEMIDMALSVLSSEAGPQHIKLLLEWSSPEAHFISKQQDTEEAVVEHESVARLSASKPSDTVALTLEQCLEHYTKAETLSAEDAWRCPHCQQYLPVVKTLGLWSLPDILVVHFKRFRQHQSKGPQAAKLTTMVKFPLTAFDMSPHLARGVHESASSSLGMGTGLGLGLGLGSNPWKKARSGDSRSSTLNSRCDPKDTRYDLYAVCYHQGDTLETGHYTAACKNPYDRQWYKFDDQRVSKVPEDDIEQDIINNEAYMLFYQRRSVDAGECSGSSSNSGDHWVSRITPASTSSASSTSGKEREPVKLEENTESPAAAVAEKAQSKPVDIPIVCQDKAKVTEECPDAVQEQTSVPHDLHIEELAFADADVDTSLSETSKAEVNLAAKDEPKNMEVEEATPIFAMDEDCAEAGQEKKEECVKKEDELCEAPDASEPTAEPKTNGHVSSSSSSSSSESSLSSRSSPRSLSTSVTAASTLQSKFNGHMSAAPALFNGNGNTSQLSSSLQLSRHVLHNHQWNGSRSSVGAVENATHHQQQQAAASLSLRHSFSTSSNYTETLSSLLRKSANTCSKDTLLFIDQQSHHHTAGLIEDDDDSYMGRSLWISPVTPHKLITVSPKN